jgi:predicted DNA-binding transcriptional regulator YafY
MSVGRMHRLLRLITLLQRGVNTTADELACDMGVSRRTLFRDLATLEAAGIPYEHKSDGGFHISPSFFLPPVNLKVSEAMGLMLLLKAAAGSPGQPLSAPAIEAVAKLVASMPSELRQISREMMGRVSVHMGATAKVNSDADHYAELQKAIDQRRVVRMVYDSLFDTKVIRTSLRPYHLHYSVRAWYVIGHSSIHREVRVFKLARIQELELTGRRFKLTRPFDVNAHFGKAWSMIPEGKVYRVELEFTPKVARNVSEVRWHDSQQHRLLDDGRCLMRFEVDGLNEITWWLLGYGDQVLVRKPAVLRKRVQQVYASALSRYEQGGDA